VLDISHRPEIRFLRARCEPNRWGRVAPEPMFVIGFRLAEVPAFIAMPVCQDAKAPTAT
jgi:hypothetical protein